MTTIACDPCGPTIAPAPGRWRRSTPGAPTMVLATLSWGFGTAVNKLALQRTHQRPMTQQVLQLGGSIVVLTMVSLARGRAPRRPTSRPTRRPTWRPTWRQGWIGTFEPGVSYVLGLIGLSMTAAAHASIIGALEPTFVVVGSWLFLRQKLSAATAALMVCTLGGALLVVAPAGAVGGDPASVTGDGLILLSVVCAAAYVMLSSRGASTTDPLSATLVQQVWAMGIVLPVAVVSVVLGGVGPVAHGADWFLVVVAGLLSYLVPFALYLTALRSLPATVAAQYLALIPMAGLVGAAALLGEPLTATAALGGGVVVVALYLLARAAARERHASS